LKFSNFFQKRFGHVKIKHLSLQPLLERVMLLWSVSICGAFEGIKLEKKLKKTLANLNKKHLSLQPLLQREKLKKVLRVR
jgi:hypothetical protein